MKVRVSSCSAIADVSSLISNQSSGGNVEGGLFMFHLLTKTNEYFKNFFSLFPVALLWTQKLIATFLHCSTKGCADSEKVFFLNWSFTNISKLYLLDHAISLLLISYKVRIHAVRAVGSLATVLDFNPLTSLSPKKFLKWESQNLAEAILSVLEKGSVKVLLETVLMCHFFPQLKLTLRMVQRLNGTHAIHSPVYLATLLFNLKTKLGKL